MKEEIRLRNEEEAQAYTNLFLKFSERAELWLRRAVLLLLISLCLFQLALRIPVLRHLLSSADAFEGTPIHRSDRR